MNILDFGAVRGAFSGEAIQRAIDAAAAQGGGRVTVPAGVFETASLVLRSNVELHLESGAVLRFTDDFDAYPIIRTRWEGFEQDSYRPLIYAKGEENIALTGNGTLEGCGRKWWTAFRAGEMKAARPCFICFENCNRVLMEGFKVTNSPAWTVHPLCCENVTIHGLTVVNPSDSPQHRRHRPGELPQRAHQRLPHRRGRRLHRRQGRHRGRRPGHPLREHHRHRLHDGARPRRRGAGQRDERQHPPRGDLRLRV